MNEKRLKEKLELNQIQPDINHALIRYRTKALEIQYKLDKLKAEQRAMLEGMNTMLPEKYKVKLSKNFDISLKRLERSISKWSKE